MAFFFRRGVSKAYFLPAVAGSNPTSGEMTAGTDLSTALNDWSGFSFTNERIDVPVLASSFVPQIDGPDTVGDSSFTFLEDDTSNTIRNLLAKGTVGFVVLAPRGTGTGKPAEVWPAKSTGVNREWSMGNDPARFMVQFAITSVPNQNATLP